MKKKLGIILFLIILIGPMLLWHVLGIISPEDHGGLEFDLGEKREKTQIESPELLLTSNSLLSDYVADRAPFRSVVIRFCQSMQQAIETPYEQKVRPWILALLYGGGQQEAVKVVSSEAFEDLFSSENGGEAEPEAVEDKQDENMPEEVTAETPEHVHSFEIVAENAASCESDGSRTYLCGECGEQYTEIIPATGHPWQVTGVTEASYISYGYTDYECPVCGETLRTDFADKLIDDSYFAPNHHGEGTIIGRYQWLFLDGYGNLPYYKATNILTEEEMADYLSMLLEIQAVCDEKGIQLAVFFAPNKDQVYSEYMPSFEVVDEYKRTERFVDYVKEHSEIAIAYPLDELKYADRYWQTYRRYDTHWNNVGAFLGVQALYSILGTEVTSPLDLEIESVNIGTEGDLFALGELDTAGYPDDYDYTVHYKEDVEVDTENIGSRITRTTADCGNDLHLVMLGDSYRRTMAQYMEKDFAGCTVLPREYMNSVVSDIQNADILVLEAAERYDIRIFNDLERLLEILQGA